MPIERVYQSCGHQILAHWKRVSRRARLRGIQPKFLSLGASLGPMHHQTEHITKPSEPFAQLRLSVVLAVRVDLPAPPARHRSAETTGAQPSLSPLETFRRSLRRHDKTRVLYTTGCLCLHWRLMEFAHSLRLLEQTKKTPVGKKIAGDRRCIILSPLETASPCGWNRWKGMAHRLA